MSTEKKKFTPLTREDLTSMEARPETYPKYVVETVRAAIEKRERKDAARKGTLPLVAA
jgi:hypothetical protein